MIKKMIITTSILCAVNIHAIPPDLAAVSVAVTPFVAGALSTAYHCNYDSQHAHASLYSQDCCTKKDNEACQPQADQCTSEYLGGFFFGALPGLNVLFGLLGQDARSDSLPVDIGFKAGLATDLSVIAAFMVYARLTK